MRVRLIVFQTMILAIAATIPSWLIAQEKSPPKAQHRYTLVDLGTFGGPQSYVNIPDSSYAPVLNNRGMVAGYSDTAAPDPFPDFCFDEDCFVAHAFRFRSGAVTDLGALPGGGSSQANWISDNALIVGISENGETDPLVPGFPEFRAVLWDRHKLIDLGTLDGGYQSLATAVNSRGQVAGFATTTVPDPDSMFGLGFQTRAFLWQNGVMQDLGTLGTGTNAVALLINDKGQIAGNSYTSAQPSDLCAQEELGSLATGAFLWDRGKMVDIGNFGGSCTFASAINSRGEVVGGSRLAGDQAQHPYVWKGKKIIDLGTFGGQLGNAIAINDAGEAAGWADYPGEEIFHAALWRHGKIKDLGVLDGDSTSFAYSINAKGQVVGVSVPPDGDFGAARTFLWEDGGSMIDVESIIVGGSSLHLTAPETINDRGEIAGSGFDADGNEHAFLLIPCDHRCQADASSGEAGNHLAPPLLRQPIQLQANPQSLRLRYLRGRSMPARQLNVQSRSNPDSNAEVGSESVSSTKASGHTRGWSLDEEARLADRNACTRSCGLCSATYLCGKTVSGCTTCATCQGGWKRQNCNDLQAGRRCYRYVKCAK